MPLELAAILALLGLLAAFLSGLLGIGGALMLIPMLLYVPELLGLGDFDARQAAAMAIAQVVVSSGSATISNYRRGLVYRRLAAIILSSMVSAALVSGWASQFVPATGLLILLAALATLGAATMLLPVTGGEVGPPQPPFSPALAIASGAFVGAVIGLVGGGSFMLIPLQVYALGIPTRTAMATGLSAVFPTAVAGLVGKALGNQVPLVPAAMVCLLSVPGAQLGTAAGARVPARALRAIYAVVVLSVAIGLWFDVFNAH